MSSFIANPPFLIWMQMLIFWPMVFASCYLFVFPAVKLEMREMQCIPTARGCQKAHFHLRVKSTARKQELRNKTRIWSYCLLYTYPLCIKSPSSSLSFSLSIQALLGYKVSVSKLGEMQQIHLRDLFELILKHIIRYSPITSPEHSAVVTWVISTMAAENCQNDLLLLLVPDRFDRYNFLELLSLFQNRDGLAWNPQPAWLPVAHSKNI